MTVKIRSLKDRALRAGMWATLFTIAATGMRFGSSLIMTRLLVPDVFGVVALAGVLFMIIGLLSDIGLRQCVIYDARGEDQEFLNTVWSLSALRGVFVSAVAAIVAYAIYLGVGQGWFVPGSVYTNRDLPGVLALTALTSLIHGFKSPKLYVAERRLDIRTIGYVELLSQLAGTIVTILLTMRWHSVWAIVVGSYASVIATVLLSHFYLRGPIGRLGWDKQAAREIINYGRWILLSSIAYVIAANSDRLLLGIWFTSAMLGFYMLALNIVTAVESVISRPFTSVGMPAFSEIARRGTSDLRKHYYRFRLPYDVATVAAAGLLFATGQLLVDVLYDARYATAGHTLQILSFSLLFPRFSVIATIHAALGRPQVGSWSNLIRLGSVAILVPVGQALGGYEGAMWAIALHMLPGSVFLLLQNRKHQLNDLGYELKTLLVWPAGFAVGWVGTYFARLVLEAFRG